MHVVTDRRREKANDTGSDHFPKVMLEAFGIADNREESKEQRNVMQMITNSPRQTATQQPVQKKENKTGLPDNLKSGIENLSGHSMDDVKVHYNSSKPAQLQALAYTQGNEIHLGPGQEKHLPHESWHVVQQQQGRVKPTVQMNDVYINDDKNLEQEADVMGGRAASAGVSYSGELQPSAFTGPDVVQRKVGFEFEDRSFMTWVTTFLWGGWFRDDRYWAREDDNLGVRVARKKEILHNGDGFNAEADIMPPTADLEFVTDAFEETPAGRSELVETLIAIKDIYEIIGPMSGRNHRTGEFITSSESGFSNGSALLSQGSPTGEIKMQVTQGIPIEQLPMLMKYLGTGVANETPQENTNRAPARRVMYGAGNENSNEFFAQLLGQSPEMADEAITRLRGDQTFRDALQHDYAKLRGFLALVLNYIRAFGFIKQTVRAGDAAKHRTMLMARTDLVSIINLLPQEVISAIENQPTVFKNVILRVANAWRGNREPNYTHTTPLFSGVRRRNGAQTEVALPELTIEIWLDNLIAGRDLANEDVIKRWLRGGALTDDQISDRGERLRGLGGLEDTTDRRGNRDLPIFENRGIDPLAGGQLTFDQAVDVALNYFDFLYALRRGRTRAFPENQYDLG